MNDAISRLGVSAWLANMGRTKLAEYILDEDRFPSVVPIGRWTDIYNLTTNIITCKCSQCKEKYIHHVNKPYNFCPNCGCRMVGDIK